MVFGEQLTIDSENSMTKSSGCYLSRRSSALLAVLFLVVILATGLVVYRLAEPSSGCSDDQSTPSIDGGSDRSGVGGAPKAAKVSDVRLPGHLKPITYNVRLLPFIEEGNFTFDGRVQIELFAEASGDNVTVHVKDITIRHESLRLTEAESGRELAITNHIYDKEREFFIMKIGSGGVKKGNHYIIEISFVGQLNDKLAGFYRSSYKDTSSNGSNSSDVIKWLAVTQFQPTDARRAFPCLDEPALKAKFNVTLGRRENMRSVSNMPIDHTEPITGHSGYVWDIFKESVPMSTYLVAFLVSEFDMKEAEPGVSKTKFRVWSRPQALAQAEYARKIGPEILNHFETFFKTEFPLPKQDMVAIPDFSAGAMENWGLITYRETAMLYEPKVSSEMNKQRVAVVVSHELAHQWFGNLVTPSWWTDLWLNEGFASYVEYLGVDHVEPEWKMLEQFIVEDLQSVMTTDALETSHPISIVVQNPDEIGQIFDKISYQKGATIIRMMNHYLTSDTLQNGLSNYLNKYKYRAASQDDLWKVLTEQAHKDKSLPQNITVKEIMDTWTLQMGYPVLHVKRDYTGKFATIQQSRFLLTTPNQSSSAAYLWWIPLTYTDQKTLNFQNTTTKQWMPTSEQMKFYDVPADDQWIIFNIQQTGYYKVNYDKRNWKMLIDQLIRDHLAITTTNRAQLIDDSLDLARSGQLDYNTALSIIKYLAAEKEYIPWKAALNNLYYLNSQLQRTPVYGLFKKYILSIIGDRYRTIGFDEKPTDTHLDHYQRVIVISWACSMGHQDCVDQSKQLFARWMSQPNATLIPANIRSTVYCTAIAHGDQSEWDFAWQQYLNSNVAAEKKRLLQALGCSRQTWLLSRYLQWIVPPTDRVRLQDGTTVFSAVSNNVIGRYLAWNFLRDRWSALYSSYGGGVFQLSNLVGALKHGYNSRLELTELSRFAEQNRHTLGEAQREIQQAIEHCRASVDWMTANYATIDKWLQQNVA